MRVGVLVALVAFLAGFASHAYLNRIPGGTQHIVDTVTTIVHTADSSEAVRRDFDAQAHRTIQRLTTTATLHDLDAMASRRKADSLAMLTDNLSLSADSLRHIMVVERTQREAEAASLHLALDASNAARDSALARWQAADSSARALTLALHVALDKLVLVAHAAHRCGLGAAGPVGLSQRGLGLALAAGLSCRL